MEHNKKSGNTQQPKIEELTLDILKGVTGVAAEFIQKKPAGKIILAVDENGEINSQLHEILLTFLQRAFGEVKIKPTAEGMEFSWQ
mgnify:FL=1